ncbi:hypothetical protein B4098_3334 [Heyndrickxia coagulans]|uniref:Uncharacterized protein n=1 Tax=Heyndrickxia coagulans TaxID=1398 RepID=A0A150K811_HEYCO|nr:hypothetical protein B4099_3558 [Heyndrickxia coagulans]KYC65546.1 hypothetical protein B4098_3334 [Heyndrickxia coagulans]
MLKTAITGHKNLLENKPLGAASFTGLFFCAALFETLPAEQDRFSAR